MFVSLPVFSSFHPVFIHHSPEIADGGLFEATYFFLFDRR